MKSLSALVLPLAVVGVHLFGGCSPSSGNATGSGGKVGAGSGGAPGTGGSASGGAPGTGGRPPQTCVPPADRDNPPMKLSQTGCMSPSDTKKMAASVIPYEVNSPLWSDGADKARGMALPEGGKIHVKNCSTTPAECPSTRDRADDGRWVMPVGTVMVKTFLFDGKLVETRLLAAYDAKTWVGYSYKWDEAQTDATYVGTQRDQVSFATGQRTVDWHYPSRKDCTTCHVEAAAFALGTETAQFNRVVGGMNQLDMLTALNAFDAPLPKPYKPALVTPFPTPAVTGNIEQRATSYLHANCGFCHRPADDIDCTAEPCQDLRAGLMLGERQLCNVVPSKNDLGVDGARNLVPGMPDKSLVWIRMNRPADDIDGHHGRMPPLASSVIDKPAVDLIGSWISSISNCP